MIHTILQILVCQLLFLVIYDLFLKKETFFTLNRIYLLVTPLLSLTLPFISIGIIQQNIPQEYYVQLPSVILGNSSEEANFGLAVWLRNLWLIGIVISGMVFCFKLLKVIKLKKLGSCSNLDGITLTNLPRTDAAFSFFNTIYLGENISEENKIDIISHEKVHIHQKHSWDMLFFELLRIVFWFNPLVYLFQNRISTLHEYIADAKITVQKDKSKYYQGLLSQIFQTQEISFINPFFKHSLIKKRIIMLQKSKSPKVRMMKYLLLLPILGAMLIYTSCSDVVDDAQPTEHVSTEPPVPPLPPPPPSAPENYRETGDVPYAVIDQVPAFPGCSGDKETMKQCMSSKIAEFVNGNFNTGIADDLNLKGRQRISVQFKIDKTGKVVDVRARAQRQELSEEAIRVVSMLPKMIPGEQRGEKVGVLYSLPIVFDVK